MGSLPWTHNLKIKSPSLYYKASKLLNSSNHSNARNPQPIASKAPSRAKHPEVHNDPLTPVKMLQCLTMVLNKRTRKLGLFGSSE